MSSDAGLVRLQVVFDAQNGHNSHVTSSQKLQFAIRHAHTACTAAIYSIATIDRNTKKALRYGYAFLVDES
jgi:hypothetical protein